MTETIFGAFLWPVESLSVQARHSKNLKNALYRKIMSVEHVRCNILIAVDTLSETANKLIDDPELDVH